jgi:sodium/hydrogen antiporter
MSDAVAWYLFAGLLLVVMALASTAVARLPLSAAMLYLAAGYAIGPAGAGLLALDPIRDAHLLERVTEIAVVVCLFAAGLKLRARPVNARWGPSIRLATLSMALTVGLVAVAGVYLLGLPVGAAVLLGAILAPTDPVLAADVQVADPFDRDRVRFALTGEAGLNDGTAFPFVLLGLGLMGLHDLGASGLRWVAVDVAWAAAAGLAVGAVLGTAVGELVLFLRRHHREAAGLDEFLALGLIALAYAAALLLHAYGFLAVFAAGYAVRRVEARVTGDRPPEEAQTLAVGGPAEELAVHPEKAPAFLAHAVLHFAEQAGRVLEVAVMVAVGSMLSAALFTWDAAVLVAVLFLVARPVAVWAGLAGSGVVGLQRRLVGWFGVRGVGSLYYLAFAVTHGFAGPDAGRVAGLTLAVVAASVVAHGVSVTPLMNLYARTRDASGAGAREPAGAVQGTS